MKMLVLLIEQQLLKTGLNRKYHALEDFKNLQEKYCSRTINEADAKKAKM